MSYWALASLGFPQEYQANVDREEHSPSPQLGLELLPDEQLMCFDVLYYASAFNVSIRVGTQDNTDDIDIEVLLSFSDTNSSTTQARRGWMSGNTRTGAIIRRKLGTLIYVR